MKKSIVAALVGSALTVGVVATRPKPKIPHCAARLPDGGVVDVGPQPSLMDCMYAAGKSAHKGVPQ